MPAVVAGAIVSAVGLTGVVATVATAALGAVASMAVQSLVSKPGKTQTPTATGRRIDMVRSATEPRRVIYGQARVSGPLVFAWTTNSPSGQKKYVLSLVIPVATHVVESFGALYVNDERVAGVAGAGGWIIPPPGSRYSTGSANNGVNAVHHLQWRVHQGDAQQAADSFLTSIIPAWTVNHRLRGVSYAVARLNWNSDVWASGLPNLSWEVKGRQVYDPRTGTTAWSDNPALCLRDYLRASYGLYCDADEIDEDSFMAAASLCDELVPVTGGGEQKRYACNGVFSLDEKPIDVMERLLSSCAGTLVYSQGRYRLFPAAFRTPVVELDAGALRGPAVVRPRLPSRQSASMVRGTYINPARGWQPCDFTPVTAGDGGTLAQDLELPFTTDAVAAQRLARLQLQRIRNGLTVELPCTLAALDVAIMEPVRLTLPQLGWTDKVLTPVEWTLSPDGGVDLVLQEDDPALYAWDGGSVPPDMAPDVDLPGIYPDPPLLTLFDDVSADGLRLVATLGAADDGFISRTEIDYRRQGDETWQTAGSGTVVSIAGVQAGVTYEVRARLRNLLGLTSLWRTASRQVAGQSAPPADVAGLTASLLDSTLSLDWQPAGGLVNHYRLRWSPLLTGASWAGATDLSFALTNTHVSVPARPGTYLLKAVDVLGRESVGAAVWVNPTPDARGSTVVATLAEHPAFAGAKTNCIVNGAGQLVIDSLEAFDAQAGLFEALAGNFDSAGGGTVPFGVYEFAAPVDLGAVYVVRAAASVKAGVIDLVTEFDAVASLFDAREGAFDGDAPSAVDVVLEISATSDNPAAAPVWGDWQRLNVGDYTGRGFRLRAVLTSSNPMATPAVEQANVAFDLADRVDAGAGLTSIASGTGITFTPPFKSTPAITVTGANLQSGDYPVITSQSCTGFTVQFRNSAGTGIIRTFDWVARGYGREQ